MKCVKDTLPRNCFSFSFPSQSSKHDIKLPRLFRGCLPKNHFFSKNPSINQNYQGGHSSWNFRKSWKTHLILFGQEKVMENSLFMKKPWKVMELFSHVQFFFSGVFYI